MRSIHLGRSEFVEMKLGVSLLAKFLCKFLKLLGVRQPVGICLDLVSKYVDDMHDTTR